MELKCFTVGPMQVNCYFVWNEKTKEAFVIDPGDNGTEIAEKLNELGLHCHAVLLTHGHFDHILGVKQFVEKTGAPIWAGCNEAGLLGDADANVSARIRRPVEIKCDRLIKDMERVTVDGLSFVCIFTPGHTKGSVCYYFDKEGILFCGDTLFQNGVGRTDLPTGDSGELYSSIEHKLLTLPINTKCYPGHGGATDIESESRNFGH